MKNEAANSPHAKLVKERLKGLLASQEDAVNSRDSRANHRVIAIHGAQCDPGNDDLQDVQSSDEGTEGAHLPQEAKVEVPQVWPRQNAVARRGLNAARAGGRQAITARNRTGRRRGRRASGPVHNRQSHAVVDIWERRVRTFQCRHLAAGTILRDPSKQLLC